MKKILKDQISIWCEIPRIDIFIDVKSWTKTQKKIFDLQCNS